MLPNWNNLVPRITLSTPKFTKPKVNRGILENHQEKIKKRVLLKHKFQVLNKDEFFGDLEKF
jgi:hypothetical protein